MKIKTLATVPFEEVIDCFLTAFNNYFVRLPDDPEYWRTRFLAARVNWDLSFGMFDGSQLVAYVIHGIDRHNGKLTAYNTGTGVLPAYRGRAIVDQLYSFAIPLLKEKGIQKCLLEVICENERALKVYERIGFDIKRKLRSFSGTLPEISSGEELQKWQYYKVLDQDLYESQHYAWDNSAEAVKMSGEKIQTFRLGPEQSPEAYLSMDPEGNIVQLESKTGDYLRLLTAAGALAKEVKLKNVDAGREDLIKALEKLNFSNSVSQYEMEMFL